MIKYIAVAALLACHSEAAGQMVEPVKVLHERTEFRFSVNLAYGEAFPLFGAWAEQQWAPDWKPQFLYPDPSADKEGAVFRVKHGSHTSVWIMTRFDPGSGHVQYALMTNEVMMALINIEVKRAGDDKTDVEVAYEWTALNPSANEHIRAMVERFRNAGAEWGQQINSYAERLKKDGGGR